MKRILFILFAAIMSTTVCHAAMSNSRVRKETRFLTDKMAYELNLNTAQYNDVYEINYDFISGVRYLMDDVLRGEEWALHWKQRVIAKSPNLISCDLLSF